MKKLILILMFVCSTSSYAANLQPADAQLIEAAGVSLFSGATFVIGNKDVGFRFATSTAPEVVQQWYREQLPGWSLFDQYGGWILYNGKPGAGMGDVMSKNQISVQRNDKLPEWHGVDRAVTTEIVIMIVE